MAVSKPLRMLVLLFNLLFLIFGIILLGIGIWGEITHKNYAKLEMLKDYEVNTGPRLLMAVAVIIIVVAFFGCCGAYKLNKYMLCVFIALLLVLLILEIAAAGMAYKNKDTVKGQLQHALMVKLKEYKYNTTDEQAFDDLQEKVKCCGVNSFKDWGDNMGFNTSKSVPDSCCEKMEKDCGKNKLTDGKGLYQKGCYSKVLKESEKTMSAVGGVAIAILVIQIIGIIFAVILFCQVRNNQDTEQIK